MSAVSPATHDVALTFEDGVTRFVRVREDQTVMDASYRSKINIPVDCSDGACGTCKSYCESGRFEMSDYVEDALPPDEEAAGYVLTCSMSPKSDLVLQIPTTSAVAKTSAGNFTATVAAVERLSSTTMSLTLDCDARETLVFLPGQYVNIAVPGTDQTRSYSFSSAPDDEQLTFLVKLSPGGAMSDWLENRASVGDSVPFTGPHGSFFLRESEAPLLLLAGGTGLAPILSILRRLQACGSARPVHLIYGATTDDDVVELDTLAALDDDMDAFTWAYTVADEDTTAARRGYVTAHTEAEHLHGGDASVYLCGPPPMVDAVRRDFSDRGFEPAGFYYEKFALAAKPDSEEHVEDIDGAHDREGAPPETDASTPVVEAPEGPGRVTEDDEILVADDAGGILGQAVFATSVVEPLVAPRAPEPAAEAVPGTVSVGGYEIGQQHPSMDERPASRRPRFVTPGRFRDHVVVITGAGQGIGEANARRIHAEGGLVVLADRADTVKELAAELAEDRSEGVGDAVAVIADLETWEGAQAVVDAAIEQFGRVDVAIHAVGGTIWAKPFDQYPPDEIQAEIHRSLWPTLWCCRAVAPHMIERGRGTIVNVSSNATRGILRVPYSAAKGGVNAITSALAMELAPHGVRVVATAPGGTDAPERKTARGPAPASDQERRWRHDMVEQVTASSLMKRYGTLDEQAAALAFVASPEASYMTGTVLPVAGGDLG